MRRIIFVLMTFFLSCGDPRVDDSYRGTPLLKYQGQVAFSEIFPDADYDIRLSVFWSSAGLESKIEDWREQLSASVSIDFPSTFDIELYQPPLQKHFMSEFPYIAIGRLLLYDDRDHDGRLSKEDVFVGGADTKAIVYSKHHVAPSKSPIGLALKPGFYLINIPLSCDSVSDVEPAPGMGGDKDSCAKHLGRACTVETSDVDCGGGVCLPDDGSIYGMPGGYCTLKLEDSSCNAQSGKIMVWQSEGERQVFLLKKCTGDQMCRVEEGYSCHVLQFACVPNTPVFLLLEPDYEPTDYCIGSQVNSKP
jgi:hypothetical protein